MEYIYVRSKADE